MATLTLGIATLSSSLTVPDANAQRVLEAAFALFHRHEADATYTPQQKLDWITRVLIPQMLTDKAQQYEEVAAIRAAKEQLAADPATFTEGEE